MESSRQKVRDYSVYFINFSWMFQPENSAGFETLIDSMRLQAEDISDPPCQKVALTFLNKGVSIWGQPSTEGGQSASQGGVLGFDRFIYERLVPTAFHVPSTPGFNLKDGQMMVVSIHDIEIISTPANHLFFRSYMKLLISYKPSARREAPRLITIFYPFFSHRKIGQQKQP